MAKVKKVKLSQIVAVDDGSSSAKVAYWGVDANGKLIVKTDIKANSVYNRVTSADAVGVGPMARGIYKVNGEVAVIDPTETDDKGRLDTRTTDFQTSSGNIALTQFALEQAGFGGREVVLGVGLPLEDFYRGSVGEKNRALIKKKRDGLVSAEILNDCGSSETVLPTRVDESRLVTPITVGVFPESLGAYFALTIDPETGEFTPKEEDTLVVDVGSYTLDVSVVAPTGQVRTQYMATYKDSGFLFIMERLRQALAGKDIGITDFSQKKLEQALTTGKITWVGNNVDVQGTVDSVLSEHLPGIVKKIETMLQDAGIQSLSDAVIVGAGAEVIKPYFKRLAGAIQTVENPRYANAIGYLMLLTYASGFEVENDLQGD